MISELSVAFLPDVYGNCCIGMSECASSARFHPLMLVEVQSP